MAARRQRGNGEGSVYAQKRPTKANPEAVRWVAQVMVDGSPRRAIAKTEAEAKRKLRDLLKLIDDGTPVAAGHRTVSDLLTEWERKALPNRNLEPATVRRHQETMKVLRTDLGTKRLKTLTPEDVESALYKRAEGGYSKASCQKLRTTLGLALKWAVRRRYIAHNVAAVVELPTNATPARQGKAMTPDQARTFARAAEGTALGGMWITMLYLGLRPGEAAGLSWEDVDLDGGTVHVRRGRKVGASGEAIVGTTKTAQSVRSLDAPPAVVKALRAHRSVQNRQRLAAGRLWFNPDDLVFTSAHGRPTDPSLCNREFKAVIETADIGDGWTMNLLRHTCASLMSNAGVPLETVADQLGHKDTRMASLHYRHRVRPTVNGGTVMGSVLGG